jgi:predicted dehydrogenase
MVALRYAVVGTGMRAGMYVRALTGAHADVGELKALADVNEGRLKVHAERVVESGSPRPTLYHPDQLEAMIATERLDRVIITSPDYTHADLIVRALDAGADVIVEKPLTIDANGCAAIAAATMRTGRSVVITFNYRYAPRNSALKQVVASGAIGKVTSRTSNGCSTPATGRTTSAAGTETRRTPAVCLSTRHLTTSTS